jgi:hypothetical protein
MDIQGEGHNGEIVDRMRGQTGIKEGHAESGTG